MRLLHGVVPGLWLLGWLSGMGTGLAQPAAAGVSKGTGDGGLLHARLRGVASSRVFGNVNHDDARAALKVWFAAAGQQNGYVLDTAVDIVNSAAEMKERLESHSVDLLMMGMLDYVELEGSNLAAPVLTDARSAQGAAPYSYVLVANPSSGATSLAGLRGKKLLVYGRGAGDTAVAWVEVLLGKEKLGRAASFFASVQMPVKPQSCILPVFFGTADACVVDEVNLNLAREINPQLGQLRVIARSRPMIESVIAVPADTASRQKGLIEDILSLDRDSRGRQLLMVFKTERMVRIQPGDLDAGRELWRDYFRLPGTSPNRPVVFEAEMAAGSAADRGRGGH
jgi:phosphonate transport system substrate-binding protein